MESLKLFRFCGVALLHPEKEMRMSCVWAVFVCVLSKLHYRRGVNKTVNAVAMGKELIARLEKGPSIR